MYESPLLRCIGLAVSGIAITVCAALFATEGYEDSEGFHAIRRQRQNKAGSEPKAESDTENHPLPPLFPAR
jgi:hypothetical protein